eukprot:m.91564 g.91564  ORF g.91564 m.91564 type:complete len:132 (+) comp13308_c0_seq3:260-655(+)
MSARIMGVQTTILRGAKRGVMSPKKGNKQYFKGTGANTPGFITRKGRFRVDPYKVVRFIVPDLNDFNLKPYVSHKCPKQNSSPMDGESLLEALKEQPMASAKVWQGKIPQGNMTGQSDEDSGFFSRLLGKR